jgi:hypothetical protein
MCGEPVAFEGDKTLEDKITEGVLSCSACPARYVVVHGVHIRNYTTRFNQDELIEFCDILHSLSNFLIKKGLFLDAAQHINIFERKHDLYDWYAAPLADKLTYRDFQRWFQEIGLEFVRDANNGVPRMHRKFDALSIVGRRV